MTDDLIGKQIGGYEIRDVVGQGGMATVYRAQQVSMNRDVAIKVLPRQYAQDDTFLQRFEREVRIVSRLEHRNIVPVYDYGEYDALPYIVMRYMSGGSVDDLIQQGPMSITDILRITGQIAPALDYAHLMNVLHRDLKPSNILLDGNGDAYITDFGIARITGESAITNITTQGVVGTPSYMSPEQAQGKHLDGRSDVYSLGVMLFEMATGRRPFESETPYSIAVMQVTTPPPGPRSYNDSISPDFEKVILKSLEKNINHRFQDALSLVGMLRLVVDGVPISIEDTQPHAIHQSEASIAGPDQPPAPPQGYAPMPVAQPSRVRIPAVSPSRLRRRRQPARRKGKRSSSVMMNVAVGGLIGCGLLTLVVLALAVFLSLQPSSPEFLQGSQNGDSLSPTDATEERDGSNNRVGFDLGILRSTLDPTSDVARQRLLSGDATVEPGGVSNPESEEVAIVGAAEGGTAREIVFFANRDGDFDIYSLDLVSGQERTLTYSPADDSYPMVSPDGTRIAFQSERDGDFDIYVMNVDGTAQRRITTNNVLDRIPAWSPDGQWIVFSSDTRNDNRHDLYRIRPDGSDLELLYSDGQRNSHPRYSADGSSLVFTHGQPLDGTTWEILQLDLETGAVTNLTQNRVKDWSPNFSSDGSNLLYLTVGDGFSAIATLSLIDGASRVVYDGAGYEWGAIASPDGEWILYTSNVTGDDNLFQVQVGGTDPQQLTSAGGAYGSWTVR